MGFVAFYLVFKRLKRVESWGYVSVGQIVFARRIELEEYEE
jgi:hypothetical protein